MSPDEVRARRLRNADTAETETAYMDRDGIIQREVLREIASGCDDAQELASAASETLARDFAWLA